MKKVAFLFREPRKGNFSIEELFNRVMKGLENQIEGYSYYCNNSKWKSLAEVRKLKADVFHITGDVNYLTFSTPPSKTLLTVHDLGHFEMTLKGWKKTIYKKIWLDIPFSKVHTLTTISEFTKSRLLHHFDLDPEKIKVIHNPRPDFSFVPYPPIEGTFKIMQIGSGRNKNIKRLVEAVKGMPEVELMLIRQFDAQLEAMLNFYEIKHSWLSSLTYKEVEVIYGRCHALFFASDYEGFGVPILEAQCVGRPVITSYVASMPEIGGKGALYVDHESVADIKKAIVKLIEDQSTRESLISSGISNTERFKMEDCCLKYKEIYENI